MEQIGSLTKDILSISSSTSLIAVNASIEAARAGAAGAGFSVVAQEVHQLAGSCAETAKHIQEVSGMVMGAVEYLSSSARELADYLSQATMDQLERSVQAGRQYREDSDYIGRAMEAFNQRAERLTTAMDQIAASISSISSSIDGAASGITGAAGSTRVLVEDTVDSPTRRSWGNCESKWMCSPICDNSIPPTGSVQNTRPWLLVDSHGLVVFCRKQCEGRV